MNSENLFEYIKSHIVSGDYKLIGSELYIDCPGCGCENHFSINLVSGNYNCFKCPESGCVISRIHSNRLKWKKLTYRLLPNDYLPHEKSSKVSLPDKVFTIYDALYPDKNIPEKKHIYNSLSLCRKAFSYCKERGLTKQQIKDYKIYITPNNSRVYFPYWNEDGDIIFYMGRKFMGDDSLMKTQDSKNSEKPLFGRHVKVLKNKVILVEGVFDHFVTPNSYALMGSSINTEQVIQLREDNIKTVYILGDPDASEKCQNIAKKLRNFRFNSFPVYLHSYQDPGKLGRKVMTEIVKELLKRNDTLFRPIHMST